MKRSELYSESSSDVASMPVRARIRIAVLGSLLYLSLRAIDSPGAVESELPLQLAYLDPGSGSFVIQALIATLAGVAVTVRAYWSKIRAFLGLGSPAEDAEDPAPPVDDA